MGVAIRWTRPVDGGRTEGGLQRRETLASSFADRGKLGGRIKRHFVLRVISCQQETNECVDKSRETARSTEGEKSERLANDRRQRRKQRGKLEHEKRKDGSKEEEEEKREESKRATSRTGLDGGYVRVS